MKRLFIALHIPQDIRSSLHRVGCGLPYARAVLQEQLHLTLRFIGDVEGSDFLDIKEQLSSVVASSFAFTIKGVGHFPPRGKPRVIWAGVEPVEPIQNLKRKIDNCLKLCGIASDPRKYHPHITLARLGNTPLQRVTEFLIDNAFLYVPEFQVRSFHLYSSCLSAKGAVHTCEASYPLRSAGQ